MTLAELQITERDISETADIETSSDSYASRFSGPIGEWFLKIQREIILSCLQSHRGASVVDVGGGHGQIARPLSDNRFKVTVIGSNNSCASRISDLVASGGVHFDVGTLTALPYQDKSFDFGISLRFVSHCPEWKVLIKELCRVSRLGVIIDYPSIRSFNLFYKFLFRLKKGAEGNTRKFLIFTDQEIINEFQNHGFRVERKIPQFFFPMVLHRKLKLPVLSATLEGMTRIFGLTKLFGSPTILYLSPK